MQIIIEKYHDTILKSLFKHKVKIVFTITIYTIKVLTHEKNKL